MCTAASKDQEDHWSASAYQTSASFVPKLATKVQSWLDLQSEDVILDIGCGDGILPLQFTSTLSKGSGSVHGIDSSEAMIAAARQAAREAGLEEAGLCRFEVLDASRLSTLPASAYTKVFSNAAMHWILRAEPLRASFFAEVKRILRPGGVFVFEMGGMGNVAEMRAALLSVVGRRVGMEKARAVDPWFFPDEVWMRRALSSSASRSGSGNENENENGNEIENEKEVENDDGAWKIERLEREYRPTPADKGGIEGWVKLMGKQFFDVLGEGEERREAEREVCEILQTVCRSPGGGDWIGYVRLRGLIRKV